MLDDCSGSPNGEEVDTEIVSYATVRSIKPEWHDLQSAHQKQPHQGHFGSARRAFAEVERDRDCQDDDIEAHVDGRSTRISTIKCIGSGGAVAITGRRCC